jgi:hypothetical protein
MHTLIHIHTYMHANRFEEKTVLQRATLLGELMEQFRAEKSALEVRLKASQSQQSKQVGVLKRELGELREQYSDSVTSVSELKKLLAAQTQTQMDSASELKRAEKSSKKVPTYLPCYVLRSASTPVHHWTLPIYVSIVLSICLSAAPVSDDLPTC